MRNKVGLQFEGWQEMLANLDKLGGSDAMKKGAEAGLTASKEAVNEKLEKAIEKSNLPAHGRFSTGETKKSIDKEMKVDWEGGTGSIKVGFDFSKSGLVSIFLMYGTPSMKPVKGLKAAVYGTKTQKEIGELQEAEISKVIKRIMEG